MLNIDEGAWDKTFETNLKGYFWCARDVARHCHRPGGARRPSSTSPASRASWARRSRASTRATKAAIISMTKTLAVELGPSKIRVNAIAPGFVDTRLASAILKNEDLLERRRRPDAPRPLRRARRDRRRRPLPCQ